MGIKRVPRSHIQRKVTHDSCKEKAPKLSARGNEKEDKKYGQHNEIRAVNSSSSLPRISNHSIYHILPRRVLSLASLPCCKSCHFTSKSLLPELIWSPLTAHPYSLPPSFPLSSDGSKTSFARLSSLSDRALLVHRQPHHRREKQVREMIDSNIPERNKGEGGSLLSCKFVSFSFSFFFEKGRRKQWIRYEERKNGENMGDEANLQYQRADHEENVRCGSRKTKL